jgi:DUF2939 family protein
MVQWLRIAALGALLVMAQACASKPETAARSAARGVLSAVQAGDAKALEAWLDRPAIRADLRQQLQGVARANGLEVDGGPSDFALDRMIAPEAFHVVQAGTGAALAAPLSPEQVAAIVRKVDARRVCVHDLTPARRCLLTFARERPGWRLIGMLAADLRIETPPQPPKQG